MNTKNQQYIFFFTKAAMLAVLVFGFMGLGGLQNTAFAAQVQKIPPATLAHKAVEEAGIPIYGLAIDNGWVTSIEFRPEATEEQQQQAWDIAHNFNYEEALANGKGDNGLITSYNSGAPKLTQDGQISIANVNGFPYIYFQANGETHHILGASSFEISAHETIDALSGEKMEVGDFVIGMIDKSLDNGTNGEDSSMHGIWVKWSSVKKQLLEELRAGGIDTQSISVSGIDQATLLASLTDALGDLGITIQNGIAHMTSLVVDKFTAKTARVEKLEFVDKATGEIYCTWIENGEEQKVKGRCDSADSSQSPEIQAPPPEEPAPTPDPEPEPEISESPQEDSQEVLHPEPPPQEEVSVTPEP